METTIYNIPVTLFSYSFVDNIICTEKPKGMLWNFWGAKRIPVELKSKLLKRGYIWDYIGNYHRGY